jgi:hypothetical protein
MMRDAHTVLTQMAAFVVAYAGWWAVVLHGGGDVAPVIALAAPVLALGLYGLVERIIA